MMNTEVGTYMGFKSKARKHQEMRGETTDKKNRRSKKEGELSCGIKSCDGWADKSMGGRSISRIDAQDVFGSGSFSEIKNRVKVCKSCYRLYKKETKDDKEY